MKRRNFIQTAMIAGAGVSAQSVSAQNANWQTVDNFQRPDNLYHGDQWDSLNPGYWKVENNALRRRVSNIGDKNPTDWFPWHHETQMGGAIPIDRDPSLPFGMLWRQDWQLTGNFRIRAELTVKELAPRSESQQWLQDQPGYALMGLCFGASTVYESREGADFNMKNFIHIGDASKVKLGRRSASGDACWMAIWRDSQQFGIYDHATNAPETAQDGSEVSTSALRPGDKVTIELAVSGPTDGAATVTASLHIGNAVETVTCKNVDRKKFTDGYFGLVGRGLLDFSVDNVEITPERNQKQQVALNELHTCYPLGDTMYQRDGTWHCKFIALFRNRGKRVELRVSDSPNPSGGWRSVSAAGFAKIVDNDFRRFTASIDVALPYNPGETAMYYTVWKDGVDVTEDPRDGYLGKKQYVGRLPRLQAPYRIAGLGGHAVHGGNAELPRIGKFQENWIHGQPTPDAYRYVDEYDFQIFDWEDDVWYLELLHCPPSTDDAYKMITLTITGPTHRWVMMRHWNIINPGDHDYGMDDVKGPEQYAIRQFDNLGADREYMVRNYQIVQHLITGEENPSGTDNPKRWVQWKMPNRDFSLLVMDARSWRSSQDTNLWNGQGWGHVKNVYDRTNPVRDLLGEEQFAWLQEIIRTDTSPIICLTGLNCMHPCFGGIVKDPDTGLYWSQRDRVAADYAGWVKAGCDRVIELLGSRQGVVSVYGDIHLANILQNLEQRLYECSFGPIGRSGSRRVKQGFGPRMVDYDGRSVEMIALYHDTYDSPSLRKRTGPKHWNFLEMVFEPSVQDPSIELRIRNLIDPPSEGARGGGDVDDTASNTGRKISCRLPEVRTLSNADVFIATELGRPIRGVRSLANGRLPLTGLIDVEPGTGVVVTATNGEETTAQRVETLPA